MKKLKWTWFVLCAQSMGVLGCSSETAMSYEDDINSNASAARLPGANNLDHRLVDELVRLSKDLFRSIDTFAFSQFPESSRGKRTIFDQQLESLLRGTQLVTATGQGQVVTWFEDSAQGVASTLLQQIPVPLLLESTNPQQLTNSRTWKIIQNKALESAGDTLRQELAIAGVGPWHSSRLVTIFSRAVQTELDSLAAQLPEFARAVNTRLQGEPLGKRTKFSNLSQRVGLEIAYEQSGFIGKKTDYLRSPDHPVEVLLTRLIEHAITRTTR